MRLTPSNSARSLVALLRQTARSLRWRDSAKLAIGTIGSQLILVIALPALSRFYEPASFGVFAMVQSFAAIFAVISTLNLAGVTPTIPRSTLAARFTSALLSICVIVALALTIAKLVVVPLFPGLIGAGVLPYAEWAIASGLTSTSFLVLRNYQIKLGMTGTVSSAQVSRSIVTVVGAIVLAAFTQTLGHAALGLIISAVVGDIVGVTWMMFRLPRRTRWQLAPLRPKRLLQDLSARRNLIFGLASSQVMTSAAGQLPLWIVTTAFGSVCAGWFSLATRIVSVPTAFVGATVTGVISGQISIEYHRGMDVSKKVKLLTGFLAVIGIIGYGALTLVALTGIDTIFGRQWAGAAPSLAILSIMGFAVFLSTAMNFLPIILGAMRFYFLWTIARVTLNICGMLVAWRLGAGYNGVILSYALAEIVCYAAFICYFLMRISERHVAKDPA